MRRIHDKRWTGLPVVGLVIVCLHLAGAPSVGAVDQVDFSRDVKPILVRHCDRCHGRSQHEGGLTLAAPRHLLGVADTGQPIVVPGRPDESLLIQRLTDPDIGDLMPRDGEALQADELDRIRRWIQQGAQLPDRAKADQHWAFLPPSRPRIPAAGSGWARNPIDHFVAARLDDAGLAPSPEADPATLARRLSLTLTGLPATLGQIDRFCANPSDANYERLVDQLLSSPEYGVHWARHWLDLARYADSNGYQADQLRRIWAYRDWVVNALASDMPFDRFVIAQIAGDLLSGATTQSRIATGFHRTPPCNVEAGVDPEANRVQQVFDRVDTTATVFLGLTIRCAQCHDHKYDPFSQTDYYRLFAYFNQTPIEVEQASGVRFDFIGPKMELPLPSDKAERRKQLQTELDQLFAARQHDKQNQNGQSSDRSHNSESRQAKPSNRQNADDEDAVDHQKRIRQLRAALDKLTDTTLVMVERKESRPTHLMQRGDYRSPGKHVRPGTPRALHPLDPDLPKNRLGLAQWLVDPANPLLARVTVNRFWSQVFGRGIVTTPEDFGTQSEPPSHPQLLDYLAVEFQRNGWSVKRLLKQIVTSSTFRQASRFTSVLRRKTPENALLARGPRFRLPAEAVRDNALAISGLLSKARGGPPIMPFQPPDIWRAVGRNQPTWQTQTDENRYRRGLYVVIKRAAPYPSFVAFDAPDRTSCVVQRPRTNTPLQALVLLNDRAFTEASVALAQRMLHQSPSSDPTDIAAWGYRLATGQPADESTQQMLVDVYRTERKWLARHPKACSQRLDVLPPQWRAKSLDSKEVAAWYAVASVLLNLDQTITVH